MKFLEKQISLYLHLIEVADNQIKALIEDKKKHLRKIANLVDKYVRPKVEESFGVEAKVSNNESSVLLVVKPKDWSLYCEISKFLQENYPETFRKAFDLAMVDDTYWKVFTRESV